MTFLKLLCPFVVGAFAAELGGCALLVPQMFVDPKEVTIQEAVKEATCAISVYYNEKARLKQNVPMFVDAVEVTLNLKASATGDSTLVVDTSKGTAILPVGLTYTDKLTQVGERGNTIKLNFKSPYTATLNKASEPKVKQQLPDLNPSAYLASAVSDPCKGYAVYPNN